MGNENVRVTLVVPVVDGNPRVLVEANGTDNASAVRTELSNGLVPGAFLGGPEEARYTSDRLR